VKGEGLFQWRIENGELVGTFLTRGVKFFQKYLELKNKVIYL
jgi:hypothetical protein